MNPLVPSHRHPELVSGSIGSGILPQRRHTQPNRKVSPNRVPFVDQIDFPRSMPILQLFFARNRAFHVAKHFKMHQPVNRIFRRMSGHRIIAVLPNAREQVRRHANVERAVKLARKDIDTRVFLCSHRRNITAKWTLKQVQGDEFFALCVSRQVQRQKPCYARPRQPYKPRHPELVSGSIGKFAHCARLVPTEAAL
jgi:hypothetical protein